jgi:transcriptional regulator with PAS, ATPase and Fis domain
MEYKWAEETNCAVTVCDKEANIIYMNKKSRETFAKHGDIIGRNLKEFHPERAWQTIQTLLKTGGTNSYTISKNGQKKLIYQTAWFQDGEVAGLIEFSMIIPEEMPHYVRS